MAISRNNLSMKLNGRVGAFSYYTTTGGRQVARVAQNASNYGESATRTEPQQTRRSKWGNLVNFYKLNKFFFKKAFETKAANQSDYNKFMSANLPSARVALTKNDYALGGCVLDAFRISEGSLPAITMHYKTGYLFSAIETTIEGSLSAKTIGELSTDLLANNDFLREGDQITYIYWRQFVPTDRVPRFNTLYVEVTLDKTSTIKISTIDKNNLLAAVDGYLLGEMDYEGALAAFVLTRNQGGTLQVSTENAILNSSIYLNQWTSDDAVKKAIASYGIDQSAMLEPGSSEQPKPKPIPEVVTITVAPNPSEGGTAHVYLTGGVDVPESSLTVMPGTSVHVAASHNLPYQFVRWSNGSTDREFDFIAETSVDLIAFFEKEG